MFPDDLSDIESDTVHDEYVILQPEVDEDARHALTDETLAAIANQFPNLSIDNFVKGMFLVNRVGFGACQNVDSLEMPPNPLTSLDHDFSGPLRLPKRIKLYKFMLQKFDDQKRFMLINQMSQTIFGNLVEGNVNFDTPEAKQLLLDALQVMQLPEARLTLTEGERPDDDEGEIATEELQKLDRATTKATFCVAFVRHIMPQCLAMADFLATKMSPLQKEFRNCLVSIAENYPDQLHVLFQDNVQLKTEIESELRRRKRENRKSRMIKNKRLVEQVAKTAPPSSQQMDAQAEGDKENDAPMDGGAAAPGRRSASVKTEPEEAAEAVVEQSARLSLEDAPMPEADGQAEPVGDVEAPPANDEPAPSAATVRVKTEVVDETRVEDEAAPEEAMEVDDAAEPKTEPEPAQPSMPEREPSAQPATPEASIAPETPQKPSSSKTPATIQPSSYAAEAEPLPIEVASINSRFLYLTISDGIKNWVWATFVLVVAFCFCFCFCYADPDRPVIPCPSNCTCDFSSLKCDKANFDEILSFWGRTFISHITIQNTHIQKLEYIEGRFSSLNIKHCGLTSIAPNIFANQSSIVGLILDSNNLKSVPYLGPLKDIAYFSAKSNQLSKVSPEIFAESEVLRIVNLSDNFLTEFEFLAKSKGSLVSADLSRNLLTAAVFQSFKQLTHINLAHNSLRRRHAIILFNIAAIETLDVTGNGISSLDVIRTVASPIRMLIFKQNHLTSRTLHSFSHFSFLHVLDLEGCDLAQMPILPHSVQTVNLQRNRINMTSTVITECKVEFLDLSYNGMTNISNYAFSQLYYLKTVDLRGNQLERYSFVSLMPQLQLIFCADHTVFWSNETGNSVEFTSPLLSNLSASAPVTGASIASSANASVATGPNFSPNTAMFNNIFNPNFGNMFSNMFCINRAKKDVGSQVVGSLEDTVIPVKEEVKGRDSSVHIFYYPWYDGPSYKGAGWHRWNHEYLPNWNTHDTNTYPTGRHVPPNDIASWYYPALGPYSSRDPAVVDQHFKWLSSAGIDVAVLSWLSERETDKDTTSWDSMIPMYLNAAAAYKLKLAFHLEPYKTRTASTVRDDIIYIIEKYGKHPSFYKTTPKNKTAPTEKQYPLFYIYDSYQIKAEDWLQVFQKNGSKTIRDTPYDALVLGLYVEYSHRFELHQSGFDGLYTYFTSEGFSHGSTMANWPSLSAFCAKNGMLFSPSVGPGYIDTRVRAWNDKNTKDRNNGDYYREHFKMAHTAKADIVSITSFNEWHEGSQIEPAMPYNEGNTTYLVYDRNPEEYLEITAQMVREYFTPINMTIPT